MAAKRRARRPRPDDSQELGRDGGNEGSDEEETAMSAEPKETPLKQEQPSPSPARSAPRGGVALKTKTSSKHVKREKPPPASQEEEEADGAGDSGGASPARDPLPDAAAADAGRSVTRKRGPPTQQGEERPKKRRAPSDGETAAASAVQNLGKAVLAKPPMSPPSSSPDIAQEDEHHGRDREMEEQEQSNTSLPQDEQRAREEEQQVEKKQKMKKEMAEQDHSCDTSPPHDKEMHNAYGEEQQQEKEAANEERADGTSPPKYNHSAPSTKQRSFDTERKPAAERAWSCDDELKILNALVVHAQSHNGILPDSAYLLASLTFDKTDATEDKLTDKIRKLRRRYNKFLLQGCPSDGFNRRMFKLSEILWGQVDEDERVEPEPTSRDFSTTTTASRDFSVLSKLYPHLAKEVKAYAETHSSGNLIMAMFMNIGDEKARDLDAKCKKQHIEAFKLELGQASLTNELLSALSSLTTKTKKLEETLDEQYLRRSKGFAGMTEGFKDKKNAYEVFDPKPLSMAPPPNSPCPDLTKDIVLGIAAIHPRKLDTDEGKA